MLPDWAISILRCPETGQRLEAGAGALVREDGRAFPCFDGIASLVHPQTLQESDARWNRFYDAIAPFYDVSERVLWPAPHWRGHGKGPRGNRRLGRARTGLASSGGLARTRRVPSLAPQGAWAGIADRLHRSIVNMLRECRRRHGGLDIAPIQANALHLPFADESFDSLFHFGGVNLFSDPGQALREFVRVTRPGGRIVWGDEQMSERFSHPIGRRVLPHMNPGFRKTPPPPPSGADVLAQHEVYSGLGYLIMARRRA